MATASVSNEFTASTTILSAAVNTNFSDLVSFLNNSVVHVDGSKAMTGDWSMGANRITNVTDPTSAQDAATKAYVDSVASTPVASSNIANFTSTGGTLTDEAITWGTEVADDDGWITAPGTAFANPGTQGGFMIWGTVNGDANLTGIRIDINGFTGDSLPIQKYNVSNIYAFGGVFFIAGSASFEVVVEGTSVSVSSAEIFIQPLR